MSIKACLLVYDATQPPSYEQCTMLFNNDIHGVRHTPTFSFHQRRGYDHLNSRYRLLSRCIPTACRYQIMRSCHCPLIKLPIRVPRKSKVPLDQSTLLAQLLAERKGNLENVIKALDETIRNVAGKFVSDNLHDSLERRASSTQCTHFRVLLLTPNSPSGAGEQSPGPNTPLSRPQALLARGRLHISHEPHT